MMLSPGMDCPSPAFPLNRSIILSPHACMSATKLVISAKNQIHLINTIITRHFYLSLHQLHILLRNLGWLTMLFMSKVLFFENQFTFYHISMD